MYRKHYLYLFQDFTNTYTIYIKEQRNTIMNFNFYSSGNVCPVLTEFSKNFIPESSLNFPKQLWHSYS